ncbi:MAG TPA: hypothetical protein DCE78_00785 [Bacteroidetes bacterium]|nr:hypothetical protein [Bacteroidota bacterium]
MTKLSKKRILILTSILLVVVVIIFTLPLYLNGLLEKKLVQEFNNQTNQDYHLSFSDIRLEILSRSITVDSVSVSTDDTLQLKQAITATSISLDGIKWFSLLTNPFPKFGLITVNEPIVYIHESDFFSKLFKETATSDSTVSDTSKTINNLSIFDFIISNGRATILNDQGDEVISVENLSLEASEIDVQKLMNGADLLFLDELTIGGSGLTWVVQKDFYEISIEHLLIDKKEKSIILSNFAYHPLLPKYDFSIAKGYQLDRYNLKIPEIEVTGLDLESLSVRHVNIGQITVVDPWFEVFRNKQIAKRNVIKIKPLLNEVAHSIDFSVGIDRIDISGGTILYDEHTPPHATPGGISFNDLNATLTDIRTAQHPDFKSDTLSLHAETQFMDVASLVVDVDYPVFRTDDLHSLSIKLGSIDPSAVSDILEKSGFLRVEEGLVQGLTADLSLSSEQSTGRLILLYSDLKVSILNKDQPQRENIFQRFGDLLVNTFVVKSNNEISDPRVAEIEFKREKDKSIFAYWWKSVLDGIQKTIK